MVVLERMADIGMPLLIHGEVTDTHVDIFDGDAVFIERTLAPLVARLPELKIVFERNTAAEAAQFVAVARATVAAKLQPNHLLLNRHADLFRGHLPLRHCLPVAQSEDRMASCRVQTENGQT